MELLRANVLSPAYLTHAEDNFYRGESWQSPDTVPMTDEQLKELKLMGCCSSWNVKQDGQKIA